MNTLRLRSARAHASDHARQHQQQHTHTQFNKRPLDLRPYIGARVRAESSRILNVRSRRANGEARVKRVCVRAQDASAARPRQCEHRQVSANAQSRLRI